MCRIAPGAPTANAARTKRQFCPSCSLVSSLLALLMSYTETESVRGQEFANAKTYACLEPKWLWKTVVQKSEKRYLNFLMSSPSLANEDTLTSLVFDFDNNETEIQFRVQRGEKERNTWSDLQVQHFLLYRETQHNSLTHRETLRQTQNILRHSTVTNKFLQSARKLLKFGALPVPY